MFHCRYSPHTYILSQKYPCANSTNNRSNRYRFLNMGIKYIGNIIIANTSINSNVFKIRFVCIPLLEMDMSLAATLTA